MVAIDRRITAFDKEFAAFARSDVRARRLASVPGIGPLTASALVAAVGEARSLCARTRFGGLARLVPWQATDLIALKAGDLAKRSRPGFDVILKVRMLVLQANQTLSRDTSAR